MKTATRTEQSPSSLGNWPSTSRRQRPISLVKEPTICDSDVNQVVVVIAPAECISILGMILRPLQMDLPAALLILVHGHTERDRPIALNLNKGRFPVEKGSIGTRLRNGHAVIVQADEFLGIGKLDRLKTCLPVYGEPNDSVLLRSLVSRYGRNTIAVVLTKLEPAEADALQIIGSKGGRTVALDDSDRGWLNEKTPPVVPDPNDRCLAAEAIGAEITHLVMARATRK